MRLDRFAASVAVAASLSCSESAPPSQPTPSVLLTTPVTVRAVPGPTFTFSIDIACSAQFPEEVRRRTYASGDSEAGYARVQELGGGVFERSQGLNWNILYRSQDDSSSAWWFQDPPIWERLSADAYLVIYGTSEYQSTSAYGEWPFWGIVTYCESRKPGFEPECAVPPIACQSTRHRLRVTAE
jgi:hypothetical protein